MITYLLPTRRHLASPYSPNRPPFKVLIWTIKEMILKIGVYNFSIFPFKIIQIASSFICFFSLLLIQFLLIILLYFSLCYII